MNAWFFVIDITLLMSSVNERVVSSLGGAAWGSEAWDVFWFAHNLRRCCFAGTVSIGDHVSTVENGPSRVRDMW